MSSHLVVGAQYAPQPEQQLADRGTAGEILRKMTAGTGNKMALVGTKRQNLKHK